MKKILSLLLIVFVTISTTSIVFAGVKVKQVTRNIMPFSGKFETSLEKGIRSIAPAGSSATNDQLKAQIDSIKKIINANNAISKQINTKDKNAEKLIQQVKKNKQLLTADQYANANNLLIQISTEKKNMLQNEASNLLGINNKLNINSFSKLTTQEITNIENTLTQNTTSLNKISSYYDGILVILNTAAAAATPPVVTTAAAITN